MSVRAELAAAARRVAAARREAPDAPAVDPHRWQALIAEVRALAATGDTFRAAALIDAWEQAETPRPQEVS